MEERIIEWRIELTSQLIKQDFTLQDVKVAIEFLEPIIFSQENPK